MTELTAYVSDPIVKIKADIMAAEHFQATGQDDLLDAALGRIEDRLADLPYELVIDITERLVNAGLVEFAHEGVYA